MRPQHGPRRCLRQPRSRPAKSRRHACIQPGDSVDLTSCLSLRWIKYMVLFPVNNCTQKCRLFYKAHSRPTPTSPGVPSPNHDSPTSMAYSWLCLPWLGPKAVDRVLKSALLQESPIHPHPDPQPALLHRAWASHPRGAHTFQNNSPSTPGGTHLFQLLNLSSGFTTGTKGLSLRL